jgi:hypothetical protein
MTEAINPHRLPRHKCALATARAHACHGVDRSEKLRANNEFANSAADMHSSSLTSAAASVALAFRLGVVTSIAGRSAQRDYAPEGPFNDDAAISLAQSIACQR